MGLLRDLLVAIITGVVSSTIVAFIFYALARVDNESNRRIYQLEAARLRLAQLDLLRWQNRKYEDGVGDTHHWFLCVAGLMRDSGFEEGYEIMNIIAQEMLEICPYPASGQTPTLTREEAEHKKKTWAESLFSLENKLRSPIDRLIDKIPISRKK